MYPTINSNAKVSGDATGTVHTVDYHTNAESPYTLGDLLLLVATCDGTGDTFDVLPTGDWTDNVIASGNLNRNSYLVSWKKSDGTENSGSFDIETTSSEETTEFLIHIKDWDGTTAPAIQIIGGNSDDDWASVTLTPSWDSSTIDTLWVGIIGSDPGASLNGYPSNCTLNNQTGKGNASSGFLGIAAANSAVASFSSTLKTAALSANDYHWEGMIGVRSGAAASLVVADGTHAHSAANLDLVQQHTLVVQAATHAHSADNLALTQDQILVISEASHAHSAGNVVLTQAHQLAIADALHGHSAGNLDLTQDHQLVIAEALHTHTADNLVLGAGLDLIIADGTHAHTADNLTLTQAHQLAIAEALHAHSAGNLALTQAHQLAIAEALHGHSADNVVLSLDLTLTIADALHGHSAGNVVLTQAHQLAIADALHAHTGDVLALTQDQFLIISDALHAHLADNISLVDATIQPQPYIFVVEFESRTLIVSPESRTTRISPESRTKRILN